MSNSPSEHAQDIHRRAMAALAAGRNDDAIALMQQSIDLAPRSAGFESNFGVLYRMLGRADDAIAHWQRAIALDPDHADAHINLAAALHDRRRPTEALIHARRAVQLSPHRTEPHINLAAALSAVGRFDEAETTLRAMLSRFPRNAQTLAELGNVLKTTHQLAEAIEMWRACVHIDPRYAQAWNNIGASLMDVGQPEQAVDAYRAAVSADPKFTAAHSNLVFSTHFDPGHDADSILAANREWDRQHAQPLRAHMNPHGNDRDPHRRIRVAYLSPDLRHHSVGRAMLPLMSHHDAASFEIVCYSDATAVDDLTSELRRLAHKWHDTTALTDVELADKIRADKIDILVDLTQHMSNNRMMTLARKPAPVQASFIGYPATTGVSAIDYRITDPILDPPGESDAYNSEKLIRLPRTFYCYRGHSLPTSPPPSNDFITFGSLNSPFKMSAATLDLWSAVLIAVPASRLLVPAPSAETQRMIARFQDHGIDPARLDLHPRLPFEQYLRSYDHIDIVLDTIPYNGGVTTCDAIWMGVPVVALTGVTSVARAGASILGALKLPELLASSRDEFVKLAVNLSHDRAGRDAYRTQLRSRMQRSAICDEIGFTKAVENAYRTMWLGWCASTPID